MSANDPLLVVVDIDSVDYDKLCSFGLGRIQDDSWAVQNRDDSGFIQLLRACGENLTDSTELHQVTVAISHNSSCSTLKDYFHHCLTSLQEHIPETHRKKVVLLNLMPFCLCTTHVDKIVQGFLIEANSTLMKPDDLLVLLVRNIDWLTKSSAFRNLRNAARLPSDFMTIDIRGYAERFGNNKSRTELEVPREPFRHLFNMNKDKVYNALVFGTNAYIGHFALKHSHIRTHYDLKQFVTRDSIWEYYYTRLLEVIGDNENLLFLGTGTENAVIDQIGAQIKTLLGVCRKVDFFHIPPSENYNKTLREKCKSWSAQYDEAIIITDIVNSGQTVQPFVEALSSQNSSQKSIKIFTIATMSNSPSSISNVGIEAVAQIRRVFFPNDPESCYLCQLQQPMTPISTADDFCRVENGQLTPFDFWEIVNDAKALVRREVDPQGRRFPYRIDTVKLIKRYSNWLKNVIAHRFDEQWQNCRPTVILTVEGEPGSTFANIVAQAIDTTRVEAIPRQIINKVTSTELPRETRNPLSSSDQVLIVDDGINYGDTMRALITFCLLATGAPPIGALVLDSRLDKHNEGRITVQMGRRPLVALYRWPAYSKQLLSS